MTEHSQAQKRDIHYWNTYYARGICPTAPSAFAQYVATLVKPNCTLIDLGCGNGRDALFFAQNHLNVIAIDLSNCAIEKLEGKVNRTIEFLCDDFVNSSIHQANSYDYAYSRFTLHAIGKDQEDELLRNVFCGLKQGGKFFIEVRGTKDPLYGLGHQIAKNTFVYNGHSRRFLVLDELIENLIHVGFSIEYSAEQTGFAVYQNQDPPVIRVIATKRGEDE